MNEFDYCPVLRQMLVTGKTKSWTGEELNLESASTVNNLRVLRRYIQATKPKRTMEIGLAYGASALAILATQAENRGESSHMAVDPLQSSLWKRGAVRAITDAGFASRFELVEKPSSLALPELVAAGASFDFIYIDGLHVFEHTFVDYYYSAALVEIGGVILFDDSRSPHVDKVIRFVRSNLGDSLEPLDMSPFEGRKSVPARIANRLGIRQLKGFKKLKDTYRPYNAPFRKF
jgi:predicted O-methyltransferase YrrM